MTSVKETQLATRADSRRHTLDGMNKATKHHLAVLVNEKIAILGLGQTDVARLLGLTQPKVSALANGKVSGFSVEKLMELLTKLGADVEIVVRKAPMGEEAKIHIRAA
jgi:predicted XRE-type DNA-binding protein